MPQPKSFTVVLPEVTLSVDEIWPDGCDHENPTAADVVEAMKRSGGIGSVISEWNLVDSLEVFDNQTAETARW